MIETLAQVETAGAGKEAMYITIATLVMTNVVLIVREILASQERKRDRETVKDVKATVEATKVTADATKVTADETKATGDLNHGLLNSQKAEMTAELKAVRAEFQAFREQSLKNDAARDARILELTSSRDFAREASKLEPKKEP